MKLLNKTYAFIRRDFIISASYKMNMTLMVISGLFPVFSYYFISVLMKDSNPESLERYNCNYFSFSLLGVAFMSYFVMASQNFSATIRRAQMAGCLEAVLSSQTDPKETVFMSALYTFLFNGILLIAMFAVGILFLDFDISNINVLSFLVSFILSVCAFMCFGILSAGGTVLFKRGEPFGFIFLTLGSLLGGAMFPIAVLPDFLKKVANFIPFHHAIESIRLSVLKGYSVKMISDHLLILILIIVTFLPLSLFFFQWAIKIGKKNGTLSTY